MKPLSRPLALLAGYVILVLSIAASAAERTPVCEVCVTYQPMITAAVRSGNITFLLNLERSLGEDELTESDRTHAAQLLATARKQLEGHATPVRALTPQPELPDSYNERLLASYERSLKIASEHLPEADEEVAELVATYPLPRGAENIFSERYLRIRERYLNFFFFDGMTANELLLSSAEEPVPLSNDVVAEAAFGDQEINMGAALVAFSLEARLLNNRGLRPLNSERLVRRLLDTFDELDDADATIYGRTVSGFFVRDDIHTGNDTLPAKRRGVPSTWQIKSDMNDVLSGHAETWQNAMSLDQVTSLFTGLWAVTRWSTSNANRQHAQRQINRVIEYLKSRKFVIDLPDGGSIPTNRGPECRYAAGFLCNMASAATGTDYITNAEIDVSIKGDSIVIKDDVLGEHELPGYKIPAALPVPLSHAFIVGLKPVALLALTAPPIVEVRFDTLFPGADYDITLPCIHPPVQVHPSGHNVTTPCIHPRAKHAMDAGPMVPCTHITRAHPSGDKSPCAHYTAKHPGGDAGATLPCVHLEAQHSYDWKTAGPVKTKVPCTHIGPKHPGGHVEMLPCVHMVPKHSGGHAIPCVHPTAQHPAGDTTEIPCVHIVPSHAAGDTVNTPCPHLTVPHAGHNFDLRTYKARIPMGEKISPYARHIVLQCLAFEPGANGLMEFLPSALNSNHVWSALVRAHVLGDVPISVLSATAIAAHDAMDMDVGPNNQIGGQWVRNNRWEKCTDLNPDSGGTYCYSGLDFLSLEGLMLISSIPSDSIRP